MRSRSRRGGRGIVGACAVYAAPPASHRARAPAILPTVTEHAPDELTPLLRRLGYDPRWLTLAILDEALLRQQAAALDAPDGDPHTEHHRTAALRRFLARGVPDPAQVRGLIALALVDPDRAFGDAMLHDIIALPGLDDALFAEVTAAGAERGLERFGRRAGFVRRLARGPLDDLLFEECMATGDRGVQEGLLERADLQPHHLERLAADGASKRIRNLADAARRRRSRGDLRSGS